MDLEYDRFNKQIESNKPSLNELQVKILYDLLEIIHNTFTKHNISYWMGGGTLLGSIRNGGLIPHDDDGDLHIDYKDIDKFKNILEELDEMGLYIKRVKWGYKIYYKNHTRPFIDLIETSREDKNDKYTRYINSDAQKNWKGFPIETVLQLKLYNFGHLQLYGPMDPYPYLLYQYGKNCFNTVVVYSDHTYSTKYIKTYEDVKTHMYLNKNYELIEKEL